MFTKYFTLGLFFNLVVYYVLQLILYWIRPFYMIFLYLFGVPAPILPSVLFIILYALLFKSNEIFLNRSKYFLIFLSVSTVIWFALGVNEEVRYPVRGGFQLQLTRICSISLLNILSLSGLFVFRLKYAESLKGKLFFVVILTSFLSVISFPFLRGIRI